MITISVEKRCIQTFIMRRTCSRHFKRRHTNTFRKEKSSSTPAAGFAVALGAAAVDVGNAGFGAGVVVVLAVVVVVAVVVMVVVVRAVIMLEFPTISARNFARVDGKEPL